MGELRGTQSFFIVKVRQFLSRGVQQEKLLLRELPSNMFAYLKYSKDSVLVEKMLMNKQNFKSAKDVDGFVPQASGLYCIRIKNVHLLPEPFGTILLERGHDILYIGIASENLYNRFLNQELRAKGHGTFLEVWGLFLGTSPRKDR